ncbi:type II secretion system protein [Serpentinicella alkaliphila]|uniref:Type IV pilus assembly protein PilA n=1 Tax=Serpentinicella alkaliphila TaxID=1734049 RepID=A0A4R2TC76_9FIRM|nr:type II secretion system protein [Serpentinicella alkaliphila]TCQ00541.1 type IV pilus assembly protein PilA [Serpentinicella alkaliphila]
MIQFIGKKIKNKKGFTLIELIVVIAILGILAGIAVPRFTGFRQKATDGADRQYAALIGNAITVAMAEGSLIGPVAVVVQTNGTYTVTTAGTGTALTEADSRITNLVAVKPLAGTSTRTVNVTADGVITVTP